MTMEIRRRNFNWEQTMKWWSAHSDGSHSPVSEEENLQHWEDIDSYDHDDIIALFDVASLDVVQRVLQLGLFFDIDTEKEEIQTLSESSEEDIAYWLDLLVELQELAEYVDITQELHSGKLLAPFFHKVLCYKYKAGIYNKHAAVRIKAAEVVTTMVHNNPTNQQLVMEVNGLQPLLDNFISDPDVTARTKALVAISSLIRNNKPGITAFQLYNGHASSSESVRLQREMVHLASSDDVEVREAALRCLLVLARDESGHNDQLVKNDVKLKRVLQGRIEGISAMAPEDLGAAREEIQLVDSLWNACYNEPSSLGEKGLLVLPGC